MMKRLLIVLGLALGAAPVAHAADVVGMWKTPVGGGLIRIERCGEDICGRSVSSPTLTAHPNVTDIRNRDPALRGRPIKGLLILKLHPLAADHWGDGWIYNPRDGATYKAELRLDDPARLKVTGCVVAPLCRSQTWTRSDGG